MLSLRRSASEEKEKPERRIQRADFKFAKTALAGIAPIPRISSAAAGIASRDFFKLPALGIESKSFKPERSQ
jgi:hypothetical protein